MTVANQASLYAGNPGINEMEFVIGQVLARVNTIEHVQIVAVHPNTGGSLIAGTVDVKPMVAAVDGAGNGTPHATVYGLIYYRVQAGASAIIMDPVVGDGGIAAYCSRDSSAVRANAAPANPGSFRRFSKSDGVYFGGWGKTAPAQYVQFTPSSGIAITSPMAITLNAPTIALNGNVASTGTLMNNGHAVGSTHQHINSGGTGTGGVPV